MECRYCECKDKSQLMERTSVVNGYAQTTTICSDCLLFKIFDPEKENGKLSSEKKPDEKDLEYGRKFYLSLLRKFS
tara:strand:+ start:1632 stop:1859 length:228 start_codon:yes stop_codon:yes gene_type:complete